MKWRLLNKRVAVLLALTVIALGLVSWINVLSPEEKVSPSDPVLQKALAAQSSSNRPVH